MSVLKVEIDLSELVSFEDEEATVEDMLKEHISYAVKKEISDFFSKEIKEAVRESVDKELKEILLTKTRHLIDLQINERFSSFKVKKDYGTDQCSVEEWVTKSIDNIISTKLHSDIKAIVNSITNAAITKLQSQYNEHFAVSLINKLKKADMLSKEASSILIESDIEDKKWTGTKE